MKNKLTSIQVSVAHRNKLKKHCDEHGVSMNKFVGKIIMEKTRTQDGDLKWTTLQSGTKAEIIAYSRKKTKGIVREYPLPFKENSFSENEKKHKQYVGTFYERSGNSFENQIDQAIVNGSPIVCIEFIVIREYGAERISERFLIEDFNHIRDELVLKTIDHNQDQKKLFSQWMNEELKNPEFSERLRVMAGIK